MANAFTAGDVLRFAIEVTGSNGALANATSAELVVVRPDGTSTATLAPTNSATGVYQYDYATAADAGLWGRYVGEWTTDGTNSGAEPQAFFVLPARPPVTLGEIKSHLEVVSSDDDGELASFIGAAIGIVESVAGPILPVTKTWAADGGRNAIVLPFWPMTVTAVTEGGRAVPATGYVATDDGLVLCGSETSPSIWPRGQRNVRITYTVGDTAPSENVRMAMKELVRYMWQQVHGNPQSFQDGFISAAATAGVSAAMIARVRLILGGQGLTSAAV